jgi:hypothetical protein
MVASANATAGHGEHGSIYLSSELRNRICMNQTIKRGEIFSEHAAAGVQELQWAARVWMY